MDNEPEFLTLIDTIVIEFDERGKAQLENMKIKEYLFLVVALLFLVLKMLLINSVKGKGSRITINYPVRNKADIGG